MNNIMKTGLVLEGGAMRGMYTSGVLDILLDNEIAFDGIIGVSAGALFGVNFLSSQRGRSLRYSQRFNKDKRYMGLGSLLKTGNLINTEFAYNIVPYQLDIFDNEAYKRSKTPFYAVITNMENGMPEYIKIDDVFKQMDVLRASASMPFVSKPVEIDGHLYLDGGVTDSIPYKYLFDIGYDKIVVILTRDMNYRKKPMSAAMINLFYSKYPEFKEKLKMRHEMYNTGVEELKRLEKDKKAFIIRPSLPITIGRMEKNPENLQRVYDLGISDAKKNINSIISFLKTAK